MNARQVLLHLLWMFIAAEIARGYTADLDEYDS